jgi:hypothetical protein
MVSCGITVSSRLYVVRSGRTDKARMFTTAQLCWEVQSHLDVLSMTIEDKRMFGVQCGAKWPCLPQVGTSMQCASWLQWCSRLMISGSVVHGRVFLSRGPCDKVAYMTAMTVRGKKKKIERQPREMWNVMRRRRTLFACVCLLNTCVEVSQCCANSRYRQCNVVQYFGDVSPAEKK